MKVGKTFAFAQMVELLQHKGMLKKEAMIHEFDLTEDQFHRYIGDLKYYFVSFHPESELIYDKKNDCYRIVNVK